MTAVAEIPLERFLSMLEPEVDVLADYLFQQIITRNIKGETNNGRFTNRTPKTALDVKILLFQLHPQALNLLCKHRFDEFFPTPVSPFPDPSKPYPGVYIAGFLDHGKGMTVRDAIRLANVFLDSHNLKRVMYPVKPGDSHLGAAEEIGTAWKAILSGMELWREDFEEFGFLLNENDVIPSDVPEQLQDDHYQVLFPYSPVYVGYSTDPQRRFTFHKSFPSNQTKSMTQLFNIVISKLNDCNLRIELLEVWQSWHCDHAQGQLAEALFAEIMSINNLCFSGDGGLNISLPGNALYPKGSVDVSTEIAVGERFLKIAQKNFSKSKEFIQRTEQNLRDAQLQDDAEEELLDEEELDEDEEDEEIEELEKVLREKLKELEEITNKDNTVTEALYLKRMQEHAELAALEDLVNCLMDVGQVED